MGRLKEATILLADNDGVLLEPDVNMVDTYHMTAKGRRMRDMYGASLLDQHKPVNKRVKVHVENQDESRDDDRGDNVEINHPLLEPTPPSKASRRKQSDGERRKIVEAWSLHTDKYLFQLFRLEAGPGPNDTCNICKNSGPLYRCKDCHSRIDLLRCASCMVDQHSINPLHRIEKWKREYWKATSLLKLGMVVHLGHGGARCSMAVPSSYPIEIYHLNGHHTINLTYCSCLDDEVTDPQYQLLLNSWFPASLVNPKTCFTFDALRFYAKLSAQGRASAQDFYDSMVLFTKGTSVNSSPKRYDEFIAISRCFAHLQMLKYAGRAHAVGGVKGTPKGGLAVECTMCPQPEKNLPTDFRTCPAHEKFKYGLHVCEDGNFKMKGLAEKEGAEDPSLMSGGSYFVPDKPYQAEIKNPIHKSNKPRKSNCDAHHKAFDQAETRFNKGYGVTGVAGMICSRHGLVLPNGVGDLQYGERYVNMDFVFLSALLLTTVTLVIASYDIACQWGINFEERMKLFPPEFHLQLVMLVIELAIPKLHLPVHGDPCQGPYSLNWMVGAGRTDGEAVERFWSLVNAAAPSTREMTPGHRHDHLNALWGQMNWRKLTRAGDSLLQKLKLAIHNSREQQVAFQRFTETFTTEDVKEWRTTLSLWEADRFNQPNPFATPKNKPGFSKRVLELAAEESQQLMVSKDLSDCNTLAEFIARGINLEADVRKLQILEEEDLKTNGELTVKSKTKRKALKSSIDKWLALQPFVMPQVCLLRSNFSELSSTLANTSYGPNLAKMANDPLALWLPSSLPPLFRTEVCSSELIRTEKELRIAQADSCLSDVRTWVRHEKQGYQHKHKNVSGQRPATKAFSKLQSVKKKTQQATINYRAARQALLDLGENLDDEKHGLHRLKQLKDEDVRAPLVEQEKTLNAKGSRARVGEGKRKHSWIWDERRGQSGAVEPEVVSPDLKAEWFRSYARMTRWQEELILVREEMRRVLVYHDWKANHWRTQTCPDLTQADPIQRGMQAYACKKAAMWDKMSKGFADVWWDVVKKVDAADGRAWPDKYLPDRARAFLTVK